MKHPWRYLRISLAEGMRFVILLSVLLLSACGGDTPEPVVEVPTFETNYVMVTEESRLGFSSTQEGVGFTGEFTDFDAAIYFNPEALDVSQVWVTIPIASFDAGSTDRNSNAPSNIWFDRKAFPTAVFKTESIRADGDGYIASGSLALKGRVQPIVFPFNVDQTDGRAVMTASFPVNRTRWNIGQKPWDTEEYVGLDVMLDIRVVANRVE